MEGTSHTSSWSASTSREKPSTRAAVLRTGRRLTTPQRVSAMVEHAHGSSQIYESSPALVNLVHGSLNKSQGRNSRNSTDTRR